MPKYQEMTLEHVEGMLTDQTSTAVLQLVSRCRFNIPIGQTNHLSREQLIQRIQLAISAERLDKELEGTGMEIVSGPEEVRVFLPGEEG